jgi:D-inositol-3-phosphate glycosyltransferase
VESNSTSDMKPRLLWVGDAVCPTGFARVAHNVIPYLQEDWDVAVLGVNYHGDPHPYDYPIYPARTKMNEDMFGIARLPSIVEKVRPDVIFVNSDPWNAIRFIGLVDVPVVTYMPVDAPNMREDVAQRLDDAALNICYTKFGADELMRAGVDSSRLAVVPHGVDQSVYCPMDKTKARRALNLHKIIPDDSYIVGNVNRNQPRKRLDLTIMCFSRWIKGFRIPDNVYLHLHCGLKDLGWDLLQLAKYFGLEGRVIFTDQKLSETIGISEQAMPYVYNCFDVQMSTTMGEGWGLTTHEGMACGIPQIVPEWSALGEWPAGAVKYVPITSLQATAQAINTIGGVCSETAMVAALDLMYRSEDLRKEYGILALERATETRFSWASVSREIALHLQKLRGKPTLSVDRSAAGSLGSSNGGLKGDLTANG